MMQAPPPLPTRFPCWCRAVYSWGGESKNDLGFIEGELIECLNAGDGSWWMGRLKRDRRVAGLFPSNFVQVLDDDFRPAIRQNSPQVDSAGSSRATSPNPPKDVPTPKKSHRRPFQSYGKAGSPGNSIIDKNRNKGEASPSVSRENSRTSHGRSPSPARKSFSRAASPNPATKRHTWMPNSSAEISFGNGDLYDERRYTQNNSRAPSPAPSQYRPYSPGPEREFQAEDSPPPPPPPPHRSPTRPITPVNPISPISNTPSPLRSAMEDVMNSLDTMGFKPETSHTPQPEKQMPWSPNDIGVDRSPAIHQPPRPQSAMAFANPRNGRSTPRTEPRNGYGRPMSTYSTPTGPPQMSNYVERMNSLLRESKKKEEKEELFLPDESNTRQMGPPDIPPRRGSTRHHKSYTALDQAAGFPSRGGSNSSEKRMRQPKSVYDLNHNYLDRMNTTRSSVTTASSVAPSVITTTSNSTQLTSQSIMSGHSAGQFSATSAGSYYRRKEAEPGQMPPPPLKSYHSEPMTRGFSSHSSESSNNGITFDSGKSSISVMSDFTGSSGQPSIFGGNTVPKPKKQGFFKKMLETAKTGAATARSTLSSKDWAPPEESVPSLMPNGVTAISSASYSPIKEMGMTTPEPGSTVEYVHVRRDVNRANSLSQIERAERHDRSLMKEHLVVQPVDSLYESTDGDEGADGLAVIEPRDFQQLTNLNLVDKTARFINSLPPMTNPVSLAQGYVCRPYKSDVQRLRAIFIWVSEKIVWEEQFEGAIDTRRVIQSKRGSAEEVAVLVMEMCAAVGIHSEVIKGYLKTPGEQVDLENGIHANHFWNAVLVEGQWRLMDCSLASPSNPHRDAYSVQSGPNAETFWFLTRPMEFCYSHVPEATSGQHLSPPVQHEILIALPCACPTFFKNRIEMIDYDTSLTRLEGLEIMQIEFSVPPDVECAAEVEARQFARDIDGDVFESGEILKKRALSQAEWVGGRKVYRIKALLPGDEGQGVLKVYAGRRGLMHSIKDIPHPLAFALPISHSGMNPPFDFLARHPTPSAARHDLYVAQPLCRRLAINNTFVFAVRQHPSAASVSSHGAASPVPSRPGSAMSFNSVMSDSNSINGSVTGNGGSSDSRPAKLGIQTPSGKILRLLRKSDHMLSSTGGLGGGEAGDGSVWETIIKVSERGVWRGLVLADRTARWCVFAEWECV